MEDHSTAADVGFGPSKALTARQCEAKILLPVDPPPPA
jgi:hypothetical protein